MDEASGRFAVHRVSTLFPQELDLMSFIRDLQCDLLFPSFIVPLTASPALDLESFSMLIFRPSRARRRVETALTVRKVWVLEEDIHFLLALYLYRAPTSYGKVLQCMANAEYPRTSSQCYGRLHHLLGTLAFATASKMISGESNDVKS